MFENETRHASGIRTGLSNGRGIVGGTATILAGLLTQSLAYGQALPTNVHPELSPLLGQCPEMVDPDNEFNGNGPAVNINTQYYTTPDSLEAILEVYFQARETVSDWSEARERPSQKYKARGVAPTGCTILSSINSGTYSAWSYVDNDHSLDPSPVFPATDLANRFEIRGDTTNSDINACTGDDTKYWAWFNESKVTVDLDLNDPACRKTDGSPADSSRAQASEEAAVRQAMDDIALRIEMLIDGADAPPVGMGEPTYLPDAGYFRVQMPPPDAPVSSSFSVLPYNDGGRYTFMLDDIESYSVTIDPDGGGYMLTIRFENIGREVRSTCSPRLFHEAEGFLDPATMSPQEISDLLANGWSELACALGNEYTAELDNIVAKVRVFFEVDHSTGDIRFRPMHAVNPERDIWVDFDLVSQFGPCVDNVMAIIDDCRDNDELEIELEGMLQERLALIFKSKLTPLNQATNAFNEILKAFKSGLTLPPGLLGLFIGDVDGVNEDAIYFITK